MILQNSYKLSIVNLAKNWTSFEFSNPILIHSRRRTIISNDSNIQIAKLFEKLISHNYLTRILQRKRERKRKTIQSWSEENWELEGRAICRIFPLIKSKIIFISCIYRLTFDPIK